jgi:hypothetical protein
MDGLLAYVLGRKNGPAGPAAMGDDELAGRINSLIAGGKVGIPKKMYMHQISLSLQYDGISGSYVGAVNLSVISELGDEELAPQAGKFALLGKLIPEDREVAASGILFDGNAGESFLAMSVGVGSYNGKAAFKIRLRPMSGPYGGGQAVFDLGLVSNNYGTGISRFTIAVN